MNNLYAICNLNGFWKIWFVGAGKNIYLNTGFSDSFCTFNNINVHATGITSTRLF